MNKECEKCKIGTWNVFDCDKCKTDKDYRDKVEMFEHDYMLCNSDIKRAARCLKNGGIE